MFTGLVEEIGVVRRVMRSRDGARLVIAAEKVLEDTKIGDSLSVSGACLTVTQVESGQFVADCMAETLSRTTIGLLKAGSRVNLERALALGQRLGGHLVLGHVDAVGEIKRMESKGDALEVRSSLPGEIERLVAEKGSIAIDGVSLTIMRVEPGEFVVGLIPHTIEATTLVDLGSGSRVNLEADVIARYVQRSLGAAVLGKGEELGSAEGLSLELLVEKGFA